MPEKTVGYRTCYNCSKFPNCKLLKLAGISPHEMANKCPDIKFISRHRR